MNEVSKTILFVVIAAVLAGLAGAAHWMSQPKPVEGFEKVGQPFFPDFQDASAARALEVVAWDEQEQRLRDFTIEFREGLWRIPSHHDYPAEAAERLARTATSLIGLERESLAARRAHKHEEFQVVDPLDAEADPAASGQRITLRNEDGEILVDYIIGKPAGSVADDSNQSVRDLDQQDDYFYVRVPSEKETYKTRLQIDLSTRFKDWIDPDLLRVKAEDIVWLELDDYEMEIQPDGSALKKTNEEMRIHREPGQPWLMEGLNYDTESVNTQQVQALVELIDSMEIAGVRPKMKIDGQPLIQSDLTINQELARQFPNRFQRGIRQLQSELESRGFMIGPSESDASKLSLYGSQGEVRAATQQGVRYSLYFGRSVMGDDEAIEVGGTTDSQPPEGEMESSQSGDANEPASEAEPQVAEAESSDPSKPESTPSAENSRRNRFVAIRVDFVPTALGLRPVEPAKPTEPEKPEGYDSWRKREDEKLEQAGQDSPGSQTEPNQPEDEQDEAPEPPEDIQEENVKQYREYEKAKEQYDQALIQYNADLTAYEADLEDYQDRKEAGQKIVKELNERFAGWYYVVPAESVEKLKLKRSDLVTVQETTPPSADPPTGPGELSLPLSPDIRFPEKSNDDEQPEQSSSDDQASGDPPERGRANEGNGKANEEKRPDDNSKKGSGENSGDGSSREPTPTPDPPSRDNEI